MDLAPEPTVSTLESMTGNGGDSTSQGGTASDWGALAERAAADVHARFGHRLMGLPLTWIGAIATPAAPHQLPWREWHYWWQAHYLDAVLDSGFRALRTGNEQGARHAVSLANGLLRGILLRNFGRFPNHYFDDMAWLALAAGRLNALSLAATGRPGRLASFAVSTLTGQLHRAHDDVLGGGIYWSRKRDFKNTPANGPAALHFARTGDLALARSLADWLRTELFDPVQGLYLDGIHPSTTGRDVESTVFTYNQGPILAALLDLDHPRYVDQAAELIAAVGQHLTVPGQAGLRLETGGDGSLFTGILCRYLAVAAGDGRLPEESRATASRLVVGTAAVLTGPGPAILSAAVQRWTILEAAATCPPQ
ncbi:MAG: glycoside hydrolase family 76 protein [Specibacter sp.]